MYEKINYTLVGIFVILFTSLALYVAFWLAKGDVNNKRFNIYYTYFYESVDGLTKDSIVKLNGVDVGRLKSLNIDRNNPSKVIATLYIKKGIKITKDMYAILQSRGVTGLKFINIIGGKSKDIIEPNKKDSLIKSKPSLVSKISKDTPKIIAKLSQLTNKLDRVFSKKNIDNFTTILENTKEISKRGKLILSDLNISKIYNSIQDINKSINKTLYEYNKLAKNGNKNMILINKKLPTLIYKLDKTFDKLSNTSTLINKTIKRGDYNLKNILTPAVIDLKELSIKYMQIGDELDSLLQNPSGALFNSTKPPKGPGE